MQCLRVSQALQVIEAAIHLLRDGAVLPVGAPDVLASPPQRRHRVQFRRAARQPQQRHPLRRPQRCWCRVARVLVPQQRHVPAPVGGAYGAHQRPEVPAAPRLPRDEPTRPRPPLPRAEHHPTGVATALPDQRWRTARRRRRARRREQQQVGVILRQNDAAPRRGQDRLLDPPFFSRAAGRAPVHSAAASKRNPAGGVPGRGGRRTVAGPGRAEQRHRPAGGRVAQVLRRVGQQQPQPRLVPRGPQGRPPLPSDVGQGGRVGGAGVGAGLVGDTLPRHAEQIGDVGHRPTAVVREHGQGAPVQAHVVGRVEVALQAALLPGRAVEPAQDFLPEQQGDT